MSCLITTDHKEEYNERKKAAAAKARETQAQQAAAEKSQRGATKALEKKRKNEEKEREKEANAAAKQAKRDEKVSSVLHVRSWRHWASDDSQKFRKQKRAVQRTRQRGRSTLVWRSLIKTGRITKVTGEFPYLPSDVTESPRLRVLGDKLRESKAPIPGLDFGVGNPLDPMSNPTILASQLVTAKEIVRQEASQEDYETVNARDDVIQQAISERSRRADIGQQVGSYSFKLTPVRKDTSSKVA